MSIALDMYQTVAIAVLVLMLGAFLRKKIHFLETVSYTHLTFIKSKGVSYVQIRIAYAHQRRQRLRCKLGRRYDKAVR